MQAALAFLCDIFLLSLPSAAHLLPAAATVVSVWPDLLSSIPQFEPIPATLIAVLHDICITSSCCKQASKARDVKSGDSITVGNWSGTTAGQAVKEIDLAQAARKEIVRVGISQWGWGAGILDAVNNSRPELQLPEQKSRLLANVKDLAQAMSQGAHVALGPVSCAMAIASLLCGWRWAVDEVRNNMLCIHKSQYSGPPITRCNVAIIACCQSFGHAREQIAKHDLMLLSIFIRLCLKCLFGPRDAGHENLAADPSYFSKKCL